MKTVEELLREMETEEKQIRLKYHEQGSAECTECAEYVRRNESIIAFPVSCRCGGLIHASIGPFVCSELGTSYDYAVICDKCEKAESKTIWMFDDPEASTDSGGRVSRPSLSLVCNNANRRSDADTTSTPKNTESAKTHLQLVRKQSR